MSITTRIALRFAITFFLGVRGSRRRALVLAFNALAGADTLIMWNGKWTVVLIASTVQTGARGMPHTAAFNVLSI